MIVDLLLVVLFTLVVLLVVVQRQSRSAAAASPVRQEQNFDPARSTLVLPTTSSRTAQQLQALRNSLSRMQIQQTSRFQQEQSYDPARSQMVPRSDASEQPERRHPRVEDAEYVYVFHRVDFGPSQLQEASCRPQLGSDTSQAGADTEASHSPSSASRPDRLHVPVALLRSVTDGASCAAARGGSPFADPKTAAATKELLDQQAMCKWESEETASTVCAAEGAKSVQGEEEMEDEEEEKEEAMEEVGPPYPAELVFVWLLH